MQPTASGIDDLIDGIVDMCGIYFDRHGWRAYLSWFAREVPAYLDRFGHRFCSLAGVAEDDYWEALARSPLAAAELLVERGSLSMGEAAYLSSLEAQGVALQVVHGLDALHPQAGTVNDWLAGVARRSDGRLQAWAGLDMRRPAFAARELERLVADEGMGGGTLCPFIDGVKPDDPSVAPVYDTARRLGVPLWIHTGNHFATTRPVDFCTWREIDRVAIAFPELVVIAGHGGWPWIAEMVAVCHRHRNVYLEFSTHRGRMIGQPGAGWEPMLLLGGRMMVDKVMFGATEWVNGVSIRDLAREVAALDLKPAVKRAWLCENALRLLRR
ncbi:amidohydrolase family protein [Rhodoligotrophos defluvii]|uniref:amidohydrolase family protein n=1 Tax=Rhodoligotrophos defluvii TaxID=2561934 RepID=UPI00148592DD|nr:amidohydrolase family protein [Rhodoligotrophos defluvii]